jgi:hypothetical protein
MTSTANNSNATLGVMQAMDAAVTRILQGSFDADSQACLLTLHKVLDNVLLKPADDRVRTIRLQNATFHKKVASRPGGVDFLLACGFTHQQATTPLLATSPAVGEETLVLLPANEQQSRLLSARRLIRQRLVQDLGMKEDQLPVLQRPAPSISQTTSSSSSTGGFDPYAGHRYDAQSAAVGANLGPDPDYVSPTTRQLQILQARQKKLEAQAAKQFSDRQWQALRPGEMAVTSSSDDTTSTTAANTPSDATLLAQRAKALAAQQQQRENGALTTVAMRQVKALQSAKVYSHVQLTVQFANQMRVTGRFLPTETIANVLEALQQDCLYLPHYNGGAPPLDVYVAPPRRLLPLQATLQQEGLVPAAKIFASWKKDAAPATGVDFFHAHLWNRTKAATTAFPSAQPLVQKKEADSTDVKSGADGTVPKPQKKKESKEDRMLKRMLGRN